MQTPRPILISAITCIVLAWVVWMAAGGMPVAQAFPQASYPTEPTTSGPIAITNDDRYVWVVNPDNDTVSVLDVGASSPRKLAEVRVGDEPRSVAISPRGHRVYVTNMASGTVSVIHAANRRVLKTIRVGAEPFACALTPDGKSLYVTNFSSDTVSVIKTSNNRVVRTIPVGPKPRGLAITYDSDGPSQVLVTHLLALSRNDSRPLVRKEGRDDGREGRISVIDSKTKRVVDTIVLDPIADTGFKSNGSTLDRIEVTNPPTFTFTTGAFPNLLQSVVIKGDRAYLPNTGSSPNGPFRFNVNVQGLVCVADLDSGADAGTTLNMNQGVQFEPVGVRLFNTNPIDIAFKQNADEGFVVLGATNRLVRIELNSSGVPTINAPTGSGDSGNIIRIPVGKNPQGIVLNSTDTRAYVMNYISRDVSIVDISGSPSNYREIGRVGSASLPSPGTIQARVHHGNELFNTSIGPPGPQDNALPPAGRMSDFGWGSCYSCHPDGLTDGVTWMFGDGPRQTISMESTAEHPQPSGSRVNLNGAPILPAFKQRVLNWSAVRDEIQDFELNIRGVSGGQGLITDFQSVFNLTPTANTGRSADLDNIAAYISFGIRAPISPFSPGRGAIGRDIVRGRDLFDRANCQACHGGPNWTRHRIDFTPPPNTSQIVDGQLRRFLAQAGTFNPSVFNEVKPNLSTANGSLGINVPSLVSVFAGAPYLHSGAAATLDDVLLNTAHRSAGTGTDTLTDSLQRRRLVLFLKSIDADTPVFP